MTNMLVPSKGQQALCPANPWVGGLQGTKGGDSSRPCGLLELGLLSQKLKTCALPPLLMLLLIFQRIPGRFLESCYPQLMSGKRNGWFSGLFQS